MTDTATVPRRRLSVPFSRLIVSCFVVIGSSACLVESLSPAYDDDSIVFDEALLGNWENRESEVSVVVGRGQWRSYHVAYTDRFGTTKFTGHLTSIGAARFLNIRPDDGVERPAFLVAANGLLQIEHEPTRIRVREPEYGVVLARLKGRKLGVDAGLDLKQNVVITEPTGQLRAWLLAALKDDSFWAEWKTFTRSAR